MNWYLNGLAFAMLLVLIPAWALDAHHIDRLFTTKEQREAIDKANYLAGKALSRLGGDLSYAESSQRRLFFEALLKTEAGYRVWLNGNLIDDAADIFGVKVSMRALEKHQLLLQTANGVRKLAIGQVYWIDQDKITESYERP